MVKWYEILDTAWELSADLFEQPRRRGRPRADDAQWRALDNLLRRSIARHAQRFDPLVNGLISVIKERSI